LRFKTRKFTNWW